MLLDLLPACCLEPGRPARLAYLLLVLRSNLWVPGRPATVVGRFWGVWFLDRCGGSPPCPPIALQDERRSAPDAFFADIGHFSLSLSLLSFWPDVRWLRNGALTSRSGAAGRLCALDSGGCFQGRQPLENKGNLILQHSGCEQGFSLNAARSVVFLLLPNYLNS